MGYPRDRKRNPEIRDTMAGASPLRALSKLFGAIAACLWSFPLTHTHSTHNTHHEDVWLDVSQEVPSSRRVSLKNFKNFSMVSIIKPLSKHPPYILFAQVPPSFPIHP